MKNYKIILKSIVATLLLVMVSLANGTASTNLSYQPKKPECNDKR